MSPVDLGPADRFVRTVWQAVAILLGLWPTMVLAFGQPSDATSLILALAAVGVVLVNGFWNLIVRVTPGPRRRVVRTALHALVGVLASAPTAVAAFGEPRGAAAVLSAVFAVVMVLVSAAQNAIDARRSPR